MKFKEAVEKYFSSDQFYIDEINSICADLGIDFDVSKYIKHTDPNPWLMIEDFEKAINPYLEKDNFIKSLYGEMFLDSAQNPENIKRLNQLMGL